VLAESQVSAVAIAVLLLWFLDLGFRALWGPFWRIVTFVFTAAAIRDIPYIPSRLDASDRMMLYSTPLYSLEAIMSLAGAFVLARWIYGVGPFRSLSNWHTYAKKANHA